MSIGILSEEDLYELTRRKYAPAQARQLRCMGIEHRARADGSLVVLRSHVEKILGAVPQNHVKRKAEPNWNAM